MADLCYPLQGPLKDCSGEVVEPGFDSLKKNWRGAFLVVGIAVACLTLWQAVLPERAIGTRALVEALGDNRFIEPRLSGGFAHAPCRPVADPTRLISAVRCSQPPAPGTDAYNALEETLRNLTRAVERGGAGRRLAATAQVALPKNEGRLAQAVDELQELADLSPRDPELLNDLAAARFVLAVEEDEPAELVRALAAAEDAYQIDSSLPEACFNRALILERLFLRDQAEATWKEYRKLDADSDWSREAAAHLAALERPSGPELWKERLPSLELTVGQGDAKAVRDLVALAPQEAREHAVEKLLGEWGDLVLAKKTADAAEKLETVRRLGEALFAITGDHTVDSSVQAINRAAAEGHPAALAALARGHRAYRDSVKYYQNRNFEEAVPLLEEARDALRSSGSPMELWALYSLAAIDGYRSQYAQALLAFRSVEEQAAKLVFPILQGRAELAIGWIFLRQGEFSDALSHHQTAAKYLAAGREVQSVSGVLEMIAESLHFLGQGDATWRYRYRAAAEVSEYRDSVRLHNIFWEGGWDAVEEGLPRAALLIQNEGLAVAERTNRPLVIAEALNWRSKIYLALDDPQRALQDLARATDLVQSSGGAWAKQQVGFDISFFEGEVRRRLDPSAAVPLLTKAAKFYRDSKLFLYQARVSLSLAQALLETGRDQEAEENIASAIDLFERQRAKISDEGARLSYSEAAQELFDEMILLQAERRGDREAALSFAERARAVPLTASFGSLAEPFSVAEALGKIPDNTAVLEYARIGDRLFLWASRRGKVDFVSKIVPPVELNNLIEKFVTGIQEKMPEPELTGISARLYEILIPQELAIQPGTELCFVPDKRLNGIPFGALWDPVRRRYLIEDHPIRIVPSAAFYLAHQSGSGHPDAEAPSALLVGATQWDRDLFPSLSTLPGVAQETAVIRDLYHEPRVIQGLDATRERFLNELDQYDVVQFAGHAIFNPHHPEHSYLVLAPSPGETGALFANEIAGRRFDRLRLVILAACSTLGPLNSRTAGLSGLARPFLDAGASAVVGTLWNVRDADSERLLPEFHRRYLESGEAAAALRAAQLALLGNSDSDLRAPASWAGFQVVGGGN